MLSGGREMLSGSRRCSLEGRDALKEEMLSGSPPKKYPFLRGFGSVSGNHREITETRDCLRLPKQISASRESLPP